MRAPRRPSSNFPFRWLSTAGYHSSFCLYSIPLEGGQVSILRLECKGNHLFLRLFASARRLQEPAILFNMSHVVKEEDVDGD